MEFVFVDTLAWYAYFSRVDSNHLAAVAQINKITLPLVTTDFVIDETITLVARKLNVRLAYSIGNNLLNERFARMIKVSLDEQKAALEILHRYSDKTFSFTDCVNFRVMKEFNIKTAFTFDKHFRQYGEFIVLP